MSRTLLTRAKYDLDIARYCLSSGDDEHVQSAASMVQQAVEKTIKYALEKYGVDYKRVHHIDQLVKCLPTEQGVLSDEDRELLEDMSDTLYRWESETRYITDYIASRSRVVKVYEFALRLVARAEEEFKHFGEGEAVPPKPTVTRMNLK